MWAWLWHRIFWTEYGVRSWQIDFLCWSLEIDMYGDPDNSPPAWVSELCVPDIWRYAYFGRHGSAILLHRLRVWQVPELPF